MLPDALLPDIASIQLARIEKRAGGLYLQLKTSSLSSLCPTCQTASHRVHSTYTRVLSDLPWAGVRAKIELKVRRLFCEEASCCRKFFTERLEGLKPYARRTERLNAHLFVIGIKVGGNPGASLAKALGLPAKIHADEFTSLGGVSLAIELGAVSVDHCDVTVPAEQMALAAAGTVAVMLPAVNLNLGSSHFAPARALVDHGAAIALSTDINPGSAPCPSQQLVMALACRYQRLLPAEALHASTINAAYAIGLGDRIGSLEEGKQADLLILAGEDYRQLASEFGGNQVETVIKRGVAVV